MSGKRIEELILRCGADDLSPEEMAELERLLDENPDARQSFAKYFIEEAQLFDVFREAAGFKEGEEELKPAVAPVTPFRRYFSPGRALVAAFLIAVMGGMLLLLLSPVQPEEPRVVSGTVLVEGKSVSTIPPGARIEVGAGSPATLMLPDASRVTFDKSSVARVGMDSTQIHLFGGKARYASAGGTSRIEVTTPSGIVYSTGGRFSVEIRPAGRGLDTVVSVAQGEVSVVRGEGTTRLRKGDRQSFADPNVVPDDHFAQLRDALQLDVFRLIEIARQTVPKGVPIEAEIEEEDGKVIFSVDLIEGDWKIELEIDPQTGNIRSNERERADSDERFEGLDPEALVQSLRKALEARPGIPWSVEVERHDGGKLRAKVRIARTTSSATVRIDLRTGTILNEKDHGRDHDDD